MKEQLTLSYGCQKKPLREVLVYCQFGGDSKKIIKMS